MVQIVNPISFLRRVCVFLFPLLLLSCSTSELEEAAGGQFSYTVLLHAVLTDYDDAGSTRAVMDWQEGDVLYLGFCNESKVAKCTGTATYRDGTWSLTTTKSLQGSGVCYVGKVLNPAGEVSGNEVPLTAFSALYSGQGSWSVSGSTLSLTASITPAFARVRFRGTPGTPFTLTGVKPFSSYNFQERVMRSSSETSVSATIQADGYSPYIYGRLASVDRVITVGTYSMTCPESAFQNGKSGWLYLPTATSHPGWKDLGGGDAHEAVDLGLSVKWATCNVGANAPEEYGDYFAWGETEPYYTPGHAQDDPCSDWKTGKSWGYNWSSYKWCKGTDVSFTKYCTDSRYGTVDNKTVLDPEDDAAHVNWGSSWRMPTRAEQDELRNNCTWTWRTQNGVKGRKVTSMKNGNSIFLPAAGYRYDSDLYDVGSYGDCWSSSLYSSYSDYAYALYFGSGDVDWYYGRCYGRSVRAVCP